MTFTVASNSFKDGDYLPGASRPSAFCRCERSSGHSDRNLCCSCHAVTPSRFVSARLTERRANGAVPVRSVLSVGVRRGIDCGISALRPRQKPTPVNLMRLTGRACFPTASVSIQTPRTTRSSGSVRIFSFDIQIRRPASAIS